MSLERLSRQLERRLTAIERSIDSSFAIPGSPPRQAKWALQDGYLSHSWQAWCTFCRTLIFHSAAGVPTAANVTTGSPHAGRSEAELAWIGMRAARGDPITNVQSIRGSFQEPTWGDPNKFQQIVTAYGLANETSVLSGVLSAGRIVRDMQVIRNAAAHLNPETISAVRSLAVYYVATPIILPGDAIFWSEPGSGDFIYRHWTARLVAAANIAVS